MEKEFDMSRNGVGVYNLPSGQPVVTGTTISSTVFNTLTSDLANALTTSIASDGQTAMAANLPMGGFKLTGVGAATVAGDALRFENIASITTSINSATGGAIQAQTYTAVTTAGTSTAYAIVTSPVQPTLVAGQRYRINLHTPNGAAPTLARDGLTATAFKVYNSTGAKVAPAAAALPTLFDVEYDGVDYVVLNQLPAASSAVVGAIFGCELSTAGASITTSISAGRATDSTGVQSMALLAATAKTTAAWAVGTAIGGLDTGSIAINTSYHFYVIRRPDTGVVDVIYSLSATAPTLPANYTQFRIIGSRKTDGSSFWVKVIQRGDLNLLDVWSADANTNASTTAVSLTTSVPVGRELEGIFQIGGNPAASMVLLASSLLISDQVPNQAVANFIGNTSYTQQSVVNIVTNTSAQVRIRATSANNYIFATIGWIDTRGRLA